MINYHIVEQHEHHLVAAMTFPAHHDFFDGHFDAVKILPAVAQLVVAEHIAQANWGALIGFRQLRQVKFKAPVFPNMPLTLSLALSASAGIQTLAFRYQSGDAVKSSGRLVYGD